MKKEKAKDPKSMTKVTETSSSKRGGDTPAKRDVLKNTKDSDLGGFGTDHNSDPVLAKKQ